VDDASGLPTFTPIEGSPKSEVPTARLVPEPEASKPGPVSEPEPVSEPGPVSEPDPASPVVVVRGLDGEGIFNVDFSVGTGGTALMGPQGAGKTRLLRTLLGIEVAKAGRITVGGRAVPKEALEVRARVGYVPEAPAFYPDMTGTLLSQFLGGIYTRWKTPLYYELMARLGVPAKRRIATLLPAVRARLALAAALAIEPELLLVDIPAELDALGRSDLLLGVQEERGDIPVLVATSRPAEVEALAERVVVFARGSILYQGAPEAFAEGSSSFEAAYLSRIRG
jgi:ABC-2 type transport system ATP-binding protein